jgi:hypothetical protein
MTGAVLLWFKVPVVVSFETAIIMLTTAKITTTADMVTIIAI